MKNLSKLARKAKMLGCSAVAALASLTSFASAGNTTTVNPYTTYADVAGVQSVSGPVVDLINSLIGPTLSIVGALGSLFCIILGVKYAKAEEPQDREKAKSHLKNAIIGFVLIFILILALRLLMPNLETWAYNTSVTSPSPST